MAGATIHSGIISEVDDAKPDWKVPLAKLNSAVLSETAEAKEEINQLLLSDSKQCFAILGDLFSLYVKTNCIVAKEILLDQTQQSHVNVCIVICICLSDVLKYEICHTY